jgi:hypothetical protein
VGYDTVTKLPVSHIDPTDKAHFLRPQSEIEPEEENDARDRNAQPTQVLATAHDVYEINLESATARRIFSVGEDQIGGARSIAGGTIVVTKCFIKMIDATGSVRWQVPHTSVGRPFWVKVSRLDGGKGYAVWVGDYHPVNRRNTVSLRRYAEVSIVSNDEGVVKNVKLGPTGMKNRQALQSWSYRISSILMPPLPIVYKLLGWQSVPWDLLRVSFAAAFVCALIGWQLGRRYHYEFSGQVQWLVFHLLFGFPGLMAFLCVQEWPARECCPNCKRMRVVDRARCEYCDAEFAPARRNGTEIFESLEVIR